MRPALATDTAFVGRGSELDLIELHLRRSRDGTTGPLVVAGEPGIGKSRLAREVAERHTDAGWRVVWGRAWDEIEVPPFWLWTQIARALTDGRQATDLAGVVLDDHGPTERFELFDATAELIARQARSSPLLVLLEDLHAADLDSLVLTRFVAERTADLPVAIIGTYRPIDIADRPTIRDQIEQLVQSGLEMRIGPLDHEAVAELIGDDELATEIYAVTRGNPLFVEQVLRLATEPGERTLRDSVPTTEALHTAIADRISRLEPPLRSTLAAIAVLARPSPLTDIATVAGIEPAAASRHVDALASIGLVVRADDLTSVVHALIAQQAGSVDDSSTTEMHRRAAGLVGDDPTRVAERAHHLLRAGAEQRRDAIDACLEAADEASAVGSEEAIAHYRRGLDVLDQVSSDSGAAGERDDDENERLRLRLLLDLGRAERRADRIDDADATFDAALRVADDLDDAEGRALAALRGGIQYFFRQDVDDAPAATCRAALEFLGDDHPALRARLLADLSARLGTSAEPHPDSGRLADEAVLAARRSADPAAIGYALIAQQVADLGPRTLHRRATTSREILALARTANEPNLAIQGRFLLFNALLEQGDLRGLEPATGAAPGVTGHLADRNHERFTLWLACSRALLDGDGDRAEAVAGRYLTRAMANGEQFALRIYGAQMAVIRWLQGRLSETEQVFTDQWESNPDEVAWGAALAFIRRCGDDPTRARPVLERLGDPAEFPHGLHWLVNLALAGEAAAAVADDDLVRAYWEQLLPYADRYVPVNLGAAAWGPVARPLGLLARRLGRADDAVAYLTRAVEVSERIGATVRRAEAQLELISVQRELGRDASEATDAISDALAVAAETGLGWLADQARRLADQTAPPPSRRRTTEVRERPSIAVLGTFEVRAADGTVATWTSRKARELVKILVAHRGSPVHREVLMDLLWPGEEPELVSNRLSVALSTIRRSLDPERRGSAGDHLDTDRTSVWLRLDAVEVDAETFLIAARDALAAHARGDDEAGHRLSEALAAHPGPALPDEPYSDWALGFQREVAMARLRILGALAERAVDAGDDLVAAEAFGHLVEAEPLDEELHLGLVRTLERIGATSLAETERRRWGSVNRG